MLKKLSNHILTLLSALQLILIFLSFVYLFIWCIRIMSDEWFAYINKYMHHLPDVMDNLYYQTTIFGDKEISMGYVYASAVFLLITFVITRILNTIDKTSKKINYLKDTQNIREDIKAKKQAKYEEERKIRRISHFYGLIEFKFSVQEGSTFDKQNFILIKKEFSKMMAKKLKAQYKNTKFSVSDKIFFDCGEFSNFEKIVKNSIKIYELLTKSANENNITMDLLYSIWTDKGDVEQQMAISVLSGINKLNLINKVIVSSIVKDRCDFIRGQSFTYESVGQTKIELKKYGKDMDVELYYVKQ